MKISDLSLAIQFHEGFFRPGENPAFPQGSRSWRNNNSGNLKYTSYTAGLGSYGPDADNFCRFNTYEQGFNALCQFLEDARDNKLVPYRKAAKKLHLPDSGQMNLLEFFSVYDTPETAAEYAKDVIAYLNGPQTSGWETKINDFE